MITESDTSVNVELLIVPVGIEISFLNSLILFFKALLIVPVGIEIYIP